MTIDNIKLSAIVDGVKTDVIASSTPDLIKFNNGASTLADSLAELNRLIGMGIQNMTISQIQTIVRNNQANNYFSVGDQFISPWTDVAASKTYNMPYDVVHMSKVTDESGTEHPGVFLQAHYAVPFGIQFSQYQAFYAVEDEVLPAGTYYFTFGDTIGKNVVKSKSYQFTLATPVPVNGQLAGLNGLWDKDPTTWVVKSYESPTSTTVIESASVTEGTEGTFLGMFTIAGSDKLNSIHNVGYGNNRWKTSAMRQWLNSEARAGQWWVPQTKFDRPPDQIAKAGFLSGFDNGLLNAIKPIKVITYANTVNDGGVQDITYDRVFLPSLEQMYVVPQISGEGEAFEYWKEVLGTESPVKQYDTYPALKVFSIANTSSSQYVRLRSAGRGNGYNTWYIGTSGRVYISHYAIYAWPCAPAYTIF